MRPKGNRYVWKGMVLKKQKSAEQAKKDEGLFRVGRDRSKL
jgi:hypothetical protein